MSEPWPHQTRGVAAVIDATMRAVRRILLTAPTGAGKTRMMQMLARIFLDKVGKVILYSNRKMMIDQLSEGLSAAGFYHGVRAAGYQDEREHNFQVSSIQTEHSRVHKRKTWDLHAADLVLVDEAHLQTGNVARELLRAHYEQGATVIGVTATPLGLDGLYDELVVAGTMSELRACRALVPAVHYGADEPDLRAFKKLREGEDPSGSQQKKAMMTPGIFGRVWEWYDKLNPIGKHERRKPCVLFGPGVDESLWFAEQFSKKGIRAAHIDGNDVWINGTWYKSDSHARLAVKEGHESYDIQVVCNRYVLREGIDWPWIEHIILAFVAGSLQTYLQTVGRGLRASPGKEALIVQDHGGAWWRHGSINEDRHWELEHTDEIAYGLRAERIRDKKQSRPFRCPQCGRVWRGLAARICLPAHGGCGFVLPEGKRMSRPVISTDGQLKELTAEIFQPRRICKAPHGAKVWERMYWRSRTKKGARTFAAAKALFAREAKDNRLEPWSYPDPTWPYMPSPNHPNDLFRLVQEVPMERLTSCRPENAGAAEPKLSGF